jgi:adenylyltransferase/sulfurtransferase
MAAEAIKLVTGIGRSLLGRLLVLDALAMTWREVRLRPDPDTVQPARLLEDYSAFCGMPAASERTLPAVSPPELEAMLRERAAGGEDFMLVDVREPGEARIVSIDGAELVPRGLVLGGEAELPRDRPLVLHCKSGGRSGEVLGHLLDRGYTQARHLSGGILGWIEQVEPGKPVY